MSETQSTPLERREHESQLAPVKDLLRFLEMQHPGNITEQLTDLVEAICVLGYKGGQKDQAVLAELVSASIIYYPGYGDTAEYETA